MNNIEKQFQAQGICLKPSENPAVPKEPVAALMVATASFVFVAAPAVASSASVTTDNLKGNTRAEKKVNIAWVIMILYK